MDLWKEKSRKNEMTEIKVWRKKIEDWKERKNGTIKKMDDLSIDWMKVHGKMVEKGIELCNWDDG